MKKHIEIYSSIVEKAAADGSFREALLVDAKSAIRQEFDVTLPDDLEIKVHENDGNTVHLPLPAKPEILKEGQLNQVSGGMCSFSDQCLL